MDNEGKSRVAIPLGHDFHIVPEHVLTRPSYLSHLTRADTDLDTLEGRRVELWKLANPIDANSLTQWATSFRQAYCLDDDIDQMRSGTGKSRGEYLADLVFPSATDGFGPATRAGDFTELLLSDYLEHELGLWVPRQKYMHKANPNESIKGVDVLGFSDVDLSEWMDTDTLVVCEVKAGLAESAYGDQLQKAINDSSRDFLRAGYTLNATKRRLLAAGDRDRAALVERFQNIVDHPYVLRSIAAAVLSETAFDSGKISSVATTGHNNASQLDLLVVNGPQLMTLVHALYAEATDGA